MEVVIVMLCLVAGVAFMWTFMSIVDKYYDWKAKRRNRLPPL